MPTRFEFRMDNVDVTHVPKAEYRNAIGNLVDECRSEKVRELKMTVLLEEAKLRNRTTVTIEEGVNEYTGQRMYL
jgi:hypothetical protein